MLSDFFCFCIKLFIELLPLIYVISAMIFSEFCDEEKNLHNI